MKPVKEFCNVLGLFKGKSMIHLDSTIYTCSPLKGQRTQTEDQVYELLDTLGISFYRMDHDPMARVEECAPVEKALGITISKNLFLHNSKQEYYLLVMPGKKRFRSGDISRQIGSTRLSFAPPEMMESFLHSRPGSASILGLMFDSGYQVQLLIDRDICTSEHLGCHPCVNTSSLKIKTEDVLGTFLEHTGHSYQEVVC